MLDSIFKVYDIRGKVASELFIENVYPLTQAIVYYFKQKLPELKTVAIAFDGRSHSPAIADEVIRACVDSNINVVNIGLAPSPVLYYAQEALEVQAGIMITASHNPAEYNGFKMVLNKKPIFADAITTIKEYYQEEKSIVATEQGSVEQSALVDEYVEMLAQQFLGLVGSTQHAVIDCGNGAAGAVLPKLVQRMRWKNVQLLYADVDGENPLHQADPTKAANMQDVINTVRGASEPTVGMAFDGDGDRMAATTETGTHLIGDTLTAIFCSYMQASQPEPIDVVADVTFSSALLEHLRNREITCHLSKVGNAYIKHAMTETGALFGGELSCHFCFADRYFGFDDGIYAALRLMELMHDTQKTLEELYHELPERTCSPAIRIPYNPSQKSSIFEHISQYFSTLPDTDISTIDGIRAQMNNGWGLIRPSNTEPVLSLRCEAITEQHLSDIKKLFYSALIKHIDPKILKSSLEIQ